MSRDERSRIGDDCPFGHAEFFKKLSGDQQKDSQLIGQFGVGFYSLSSSRSASVLTSSRRPCASEGVRGSQPPTASFRSKPWSAQNAAPRSFLHLRDDAKEFLDSWHLRSLVRRYSDHIAFPWRMPKEGEATLEYEAINRGRRSGRGPRVRSRTMNTSSSIATSHMIPATR